MATYSLSGTGTQTLTSGTGALYVSITTLPIGSGHGGANPTDYYGIGTIRPGNATAYWEPWPVIGGPQWIPVPAGTTRIGYALTDTAVVSVVEVAGSSPLAFPLASLPDVALASVADAQVLTYQASSSRWINATPTGGGGGASAWQRLTTYSVTADQSNISIPSSFVWTNLGWSQFSFTVPSGVLLTLVAVTGVCRWGSAVDRLALRAVMDSTNGTPYQGANVWTSGSNISMGLSNTFAYWSLAAGSHTFKLQANGFLAQTVFMQAATASTVDGYSAAVYAQ